MRFDAFAYVYLLGLLPILLGALRLWLLAPAADARGGSSSCRSPPGCCPRIDRPRRWAKALCVVGAVACLVVALMQPQWGETEEDVPRRGRDLVIVLDVSLSMLAEDAPPNRLEHAKSLVRELVETVRAEGGHRLGLVTFAGRAALQSPLTLDYGLFLERLAEAHPARVPIKGTLIGDALRQTVRALGGLEPDYTDLVLITDGDDHGSLPDEAAAAGLPIRASRFTSWASGDPRGGAHIPLEDGNGRSTFLRYDGSEVSTRMRSDVLASMALRATASIVAADHGRGAARAPVRRPDRRVCRAGRSMPIVARSRPSGSSGSSWRP